MLAELIRFEEETTLVMRSGIQFLDFGLTLDLRKENPGQFSRLEYSGLPLRLAYDETRDCHMHPFARTKAAVDRALETPVADSAALFENAWLPIPFLRRHATAFAQGPGNWARACLISIPPGSDVHGHTHRLVLAFDTSLYEQNHADLAYLAPTKDDADSGSKFALAWQDEAVAWFIGLNWVDAWLRDVYEENAPSRLRLAQDDVAKDVETQRHLSHYLNILWLIGMHARPPQLKILSNRSDDVHKPISVDLVLDVGNSRTCGILIEEHAQDHNGLNTRYELELRDLTRPHFVAAEPFESRVEFAEAAFGKVDRSCQSGRNDAFLWPTITRIGPEAARLAARRRGTEGSTGLSSPKRYLWDEDRFEPCWHFNDAFNKAEKEPLATAAPFGNLIDEMGEALFTLPPEQQLQVFVPHYSRSAIMAFMIAEILVQALCQMNSPSQRLKMSHANLPRQLRSVILTIPPAMPKPERELFQERVRQAIGLVWKAMGWHPVDLDIDDEQNRKQAWPPLPRAEVKWDEATCAQVVYVFSEVVNTFGGHPEEFLRIMRRRRANSESDASTKSLRIASIDIGGGTTDLVVNDYSLDDGRGSNVYILPAQRFRDGFKIAGDDIVLDVIQKMIVPALETALIEHGLSDAAPALSRLIGAEAGIVQDMVLRQQLTLQLFHPLALALLKAYESYDPIAGADVERPTFEEVFANMAPSRDRPTEEVLEYFSRGIRRILGSSHPAFDLMQVRLPFDLNKLHRLFIGDTMEIVKPIRSLCELIHLYDCDVLLISGRPSRLPGIQALVRGLLALPPDRIVPLHNYRTGTWYPFHRQGRIDDPKTTAAVGAMLCMLGQGRIPNFFFRINEFKSYSTVRYIGLMDQNMVIKDADAYYRDVDLDNDDYRLPDTPFEMRGRMILGFRQMAVERWNASPLYMLEFSADDDRARKALYSETNHAAAPPALEVSLKKAASKRTERLAIAGVSRKGGGALPNSALKIRLHTLVTQGIGENSYWLDTGSIVR